MKTAKRKIVSIIVGLTMLISSMILSTVVASADTPVTPSYPMQVSTVFTTTDAPSSITDKWNQTHTVPYINFVYDDATYTSPFTTVIPGATTTNHWLLGYPTAMDDIYSCYGSLNSNDYTGWSSGWDTSNTPNGAYVDEMFNLPEITTYYNATKKKWKGYSWQIYMNTYSTADTWNPTTRTGKVPQYASNIQVFNGDVVVCRFMYTEETW